MYIARRCAARERIPEARGCKDDCRGLALDTARLPARLRRSGRLAELTTRRPAANWTQLASLRAFGAPGGSHSLPLVYAAPERVAREPDAPRDLPRFAPKPIARRVLRAERRFALPSRGPGGGADERPGGARARPTRSIERLRRRKQPRARTARGRARGHGGRARRGRERGRARGRRAVGDARVAAERSTERLDVESIRRVLQPEKTRALPWRARADFVSTRGRARGRRAGRRHARSRPIVRANGFRRSIRARDGSRRFASFPEVSHAGDGRGRRGAAARRVDPKREHGTMRLCGY